MRPVEPERERGGRELQAGERGTGGKARRQVSAGGEG